MKQRRIRHIVLFFTLTQLFLASVGLSIQQVWCYCEGEMRVSLFAKLGTCCEDPHPPTAHGSTCHASMHCDPLNNEPCGSLEVDYWHLDELMQAPALTWNLQLPFYFYSPFEVPSKSFKAQQPARARFIPRGPPPQQNGQTLRKQLQSFLC